MNQELATMLRKFRLEGPCGGETLASVAEKLGVHSSYLYRVEEGFYVPSDENLGRMADLYRLTSEDRLRIFAAAHLDQPLQDVFAAVSKDKGEKAAQKVILPFFYRKKK